MAGDQLQMFGDADFELDAEHEIYILRGDPDELYEVAIPVEDRRGQAWLTDWHRGIAAGIAEARRWRHGTHVYPARLSAWPRPSDGARAKASDDGR